MKVVHQEAITKGMIPKAGALGGRETCEIDARRADEAFLAAATVGESSASVFFVTLQVAGRLRRQGSWKVQRGLFYDPEALEYHRYAVGRLRGYMLNSHFVIVPWDQLADHAIALKAMFGAQLFVRPCSAKKPFTGFSVSWDGLSAEVSALSQTERVEAAELCVVAAQRPLDPTEWRCWMFDGAVVTSAPYSWSGDLRDTPGAVLDLAGEIAPLIEHLGPVVVDFGMSEGKAKVIELNAVSTAGFYDGMDVGRLVEACIRSAEEGL